MITLYSQNEPSTTLNERQLYPECPDTCYAYLIFHWIIRVISKLFYTSFVSAPSQQNTDEENVRCRKLQHVQHEGL